MFMLLLAIGRILLGELDGLSADVLPSVVEVLEPFHEARGEYRVYRLYVLHAGENLPHHHKDTDVSAYPLHRTDDRASDGGVAGDVGEHQEEHVDDYLLAEP